MNQKNVFRSIGIAAILCLCATQIFAQFNVDGWLIDRWGETTTTFGQNIKAITIGNFSAAFRPRAALHISANILTPPTNPATMFLPGELFRTDGPGNRINAWRLWTGLQPGQPPDGSPLSEKGMIFNYGNNPVVADQTNFSLQASVWDMTFHTLPITANTVGTERVRIVGVQRIFTPGPPLQPTIIKAGNVGIGCPNPLTMLHIGDFSGLGSGYRTWMDIGTFYNYSYGFDNMYVGLKVLGNDMSEAIINWGNNPVPGDLGDRLRFVFTAATSLGLPASDASVPVIAGSVTVIVSSATSAAVSSSSLVSEVVPSNQREFPSDPAVSVKASPLVIEPTAVISPPPVPPISVTPVPLPT